MSIKIPRQLIKVREIQVEPKINMAANAWITGICTMPNGDVILADNNNDCVLVYTMTYEYINSTKLCDSPWDVDTIDKSHFVTSLAGKSDPKQIHIFELTDKSKPEIHYTIGLPFTCHGISYANNALIVTCVEEASVKMIDMRGNVKWSVTGLPGTSHPFFKRPLYVCARLDGLTFVITDVASHSITVVSYKGDILNSKTIKKGQPLGVTVDVNGKIMVCLTGNDSVIETTDTLISEVIRGTRDRGIVLPQTITYHAKTDRYLISSSLSNDLGIYEMM